MINEKAQVKDQISFILNGKPVEPPKPAEVEDSKDQPESPKQDEE
jgi:hypothetical protein